MSEPTVRGLVHVIEETKTYGKNGFRKRLVVLEQDKGRFTNYVPVEFVQDSCDSVDQLSVGDDVEVTYRLSGRKWQKDERSEVKYFLSAEAVDFKVLQATAEASEPAGGAPDGESPPLSDDDVPF